ncbi:hypothetical protein PR048_024288 [Dryococelus australis]|uniref:Mutator-like transposase domain-containing protein n=1 Tax=Dryococelus australis TaxID=614101 RepID=A0ABQ9GN86_9NEOP|nr:hypothetical protein PR048_024288 [Dryococelus australis]
MNVNTAAVSGSMAIGLGFSQLGEFFAALDRPFMSKSTWKSRQEQVSTVFQEVANKEMEKAAKDGAILARKCVDVD